MSELQNLTDVLAKAATEGPLSLQDLRARATASDPRAELLPIHALEQLLEDDDRFVGQAGLWRLVPDAPVAGAKISFVEEPADGDEDRQLRIDEFVILDVEATDREPSRAELIEVAALKVQGWTIKETFETFVYTDDLPHGISALTGISPADLRTARRSGRSYQFRRAQRWSGDRRS